MTLWLPFALALSSWLGFGFGIIPFYRGNQPTSSSVLDHLYPVTVAFFLGYLAITLLPHALFESKAPIVAFVAGGGGMAFLTRKVFHRDPCCEAGHTHDPLGWTFFLAMSVCSVNDGILIGLIHPPLGSGLSLGMDFHKVTSSLALAMALGYWHYRGNRLFLLGLANGLISPGFYFLGLILRSVPRAPLDLLLGFSAGVLTYTVLTGMLPHSGQMLKRKPTAWIGFGAALALSLYLGYLHRAWHSFE